MTGHQLAMKFYDAEMLRWVREPDFTYLEQDMDVVLAAVFDATELCQLLTLQDLPDRKKQWVAMAILGLIDEGQTHKDEILVQNLSDALRKVSALCQPMLEELSPADTALLQRILKENSTDG